MTTALKVGYRHIDTAFLYKNEVPVGKAIADSGIPRDEIFVTTKLASVGHMDPLKSLKTSLASLQLEYVDLYLMHWPVALNPNNKSHPTFPTLPDGRRDILFERDFVDTYIDMQQLVHLGLAKAIGVSNFTVTNLKRLLADPRVTIRPAANQVELHPYLPQPKLLEFCKNKNIVVEAYSPLGSTDSPFLKNETLVGLANKYNVEPANILISWAVWRGTVVLPKSTNPARIESNFHLVDLSDEDGQTVNEISSKLGTKRLILPFWEPVVVFDTDE